MHCRMAGLQGQALSGFLASSGRGADSPLYSLNKKVKEVLGVENQDLSKIKLEKQPYEPPKATCVRVQLEERVLGCNFSTVKICGLTE